MSLAIDVEHPSRLQASAMIMTDYELLTFRDLVTDLW